MRDGRRIDQTLHVRVDCPEFLHYIGIRSKTVLLVVILGDMESGIWFYRSGNPSICFRSKMIPRFRSKRSLLFVMIEYGRPILAGPGISRRIVALPEYV